MPGVYLFNFTLVIVSWYDRLLLWRIVNLFKKGAKQRESVNGFVNRAVDETTDQVKSGQ